MRRFEQQRSLTFERLRDEVFEPHWQDETWHEVLRLVASMIDESLAEMIVEYLMKQQMKSQAFNRILAAKCVADIGKQSEIYKKYALMLMNFFEDFSL